MTFYKQELSVKEITQTTQVLDVVFGSTLTSWPLDVLFILAAACSILCLCEGVV